MIKVETKISNTAVVSPSKITAIVKRHLKTRGVTDASVEVEVVGKDTMATLNKKYMKKDGPTDVLSFPLPKISTSDNLIGTIVLCHDIIKSNSTIDGVGFESEFDKNLTHGIDHLLGIHHE